MDTRSRSFYLFACLLFFLIAGVFQHAILNRYSDQLIKKSEPQATAWDPRSFRLLTLGEWATGLDLLWLRNLQDPRIDHVKKGEHPWNFYDYDLITDFDPAFGEVYYHGAMTLTIIRNDVAGGLHLFEKANRFRKEKLPHLPKEYQKEFWEEGWLMPLRLAYVYLFEYDNIIKSAEYYKEASLEKGSPPYLKHLVERFNKKDGLYEVGTKLISTLLNGENPPEVKEKLERRLAILQFKLKLKHLNEEWVIAKKKKVSLKDFVISRRIPPVDPFGGKIIMKSDGEIGTEPELEKVLGL